MGKFATLFESTGAHSPIKRKFAVSAKDEHGKEYSFDHEAFSPRGVHKLDRFNDGGHTLVSIKHGDKDVTNESFQVDESQEHDHLESEARQLRHHIDDGSQTHAEVLAKEMTAKHGKEALEHVKKAHAANTESDSAFHKMKAKVLDHQSKNPNDSIGQSHTHLLANDAEYAEHAKTREGKTLERQEHMAKAKRASFVHNHKHLD